MIKLLNLLYEIEGTEEVELIGEKVLVYYNLHKHTFSVRYEGKVVLHADYLKLKDVTFKVREGGRQQVINTKQKNVHAFVIGTVEDYIKYPATSTLTAHGDLVTYNPYKYNSFVIKNTEEPIYKASEVEMVNINNKGFIYKVK